MTAAALCALLGGCVIAVGNGDTADAAPIETRRFEVAAFDRVVLAAGDAVRVLSGDTASVVASGDPRALSALSVTVEHGQLRVARKSGRWSDRGAVVTVTVPVLRDAELSGSGSMDVEAVAPAFAAHLSGSGSLDLRGVRGDTVTIDADESGSVTASGAVRSLDVRVRGSGDVDARALAARDVRVDLSGSGSVRAQASQTADVSAGGSGDVTIAGSPRCSVSKGGSGSVRCG
ncbi:hypothetical protein J2Y58_001068 [Sphingomonas sp. BE138]|uniref:head GIN domain-containing protein n=1 Tax=Sphingomonas sp. BE138 TaxID=2817845 RepID=UPI00286773AA|nr:head GIN domain-containing protein [Sphingomonas sp. BE138]MDR6787716.1 hypothetical protein [Sphingomonas sp. BE138]